MSVLDSEIVAGDLRQRQFLDGIDSTEDDDDNDEKGRRDDENGRRCVAATSEAVGGSRSSDLPSWPFLHASSSNN